MTTRLRYDGDTPSLADTMRMAAENVLGNFYSALPAKVVKYDAAKQCADVQPVVKTVDADGNSVTMPVLPCCPVLFPAGGGFSIAWSLSPGDYCLVVFSSQSMAQWIPQGADDADMESARRGSLTDGVVIPGLRPQNAVLAAAGYTGFQAGLDDGTGTIKIDAGGNVEIEGALIKAGAGAADFVALAQKVLDELNSMNTAISTHTHGGVTAGAGTTAPPVWTHTPGSVAATKVKAE